MRRRPDGQIDRRLYPTILTAGPNVSHIPIREFVSVTYAAEVSEHDEQPRAHRSSLLQATAIAAFLGLIPIPAGLFTLTRPVSTPLQSCGSAGAFLLEGRVDQPVNPSDPPEGVTDEQIRDHLEHPCQERAANRARPAAAAIVAGLAIITVAGLTEVGVRWRRRVTRRRARHVRPPTSSNA